MNLIVAGNVIEVSFDADDPQSGYITLPDGYSK